MRVWIDDQPWLADVGFGFGGLLEPVPCCPSGPYFQSGWGFRLVWDEPELVMQAARGDEWVDQYGVLLSPVPLIDIETANWMTSTHPGSPFVRGPIISATATDGLRTLVRGDSEHGFVLIEQSPGRRVTTPVHGCQLRCILQHRYGLHSERVPEFAADELVGY